MRRHHYYEELRSAAVARKGEAKSRARRSRTHFYEVTRAIGAERFGMGQNPINARRPKPVISAETFAMLRLALAEDGCDWAFDHMGSDEQLVARMAEWHFGRGTSVKFYRWLERVLVK